MRERTRRARFGHRTPRRLHPALRADRATPGGFAGACDAFAREASNEPVDARRPLRFSTIQVEELTPLQVDNVLDCHLLVIEHHRARFRHELVGQFFAAEDIVRSATSGQSLGWLLGAPANAALTETALGIESRRPTGVGSTPRTRKPRTHFLRAHRSLWRRCRRDGRTRDSGRAAQCGRCHRDRDSDLSRAGTDSSDAGSLSVGGPSGR